MARSEKPAAPQQRDAGVRERWTAERREQIAVYFLQVYATSHTSTLRTPKPRSWGTVGQAGGKANIVQGTEGVKEKGQYQEWAVSRVVRFRQMARSLGFVELVDLGGQDEIALRQTVDFVRPGRDLDFSPGKEDVWVVPLLLRELAYAVHELESLAKVGKREGLRDVVLLNHIPSIHLLFDGGKLLTLERGTPPRQGT